MWEERLKTVGDQILRFAQRLGVEEAEAYAVSNRVLTIRLVNNAVFEAKGVHDIGVGVRVIQNGGLGFSSTADLSVRALENKVEAALATSKARKLPFKYRLPPPAKAPEVPGLYDKRLAKLPSDEAVELAYRMVEQSLAYSPKIADNAGVLNLVEYHVVVMNSHGVDADTRGTFFEASLTATAKDGAQSSEGFDSTAGRSMDELRPGEVGRRAAEIAVSGLGAQPLTEGTYTVILDPQPASDLNSYTSMLVSPMVAKLYYPLFLDKLGRKVASDQLTILDDPLMPGGIGSSPIDDEGCPSKQVTIIEDGVLKSFVYDTFYGAMEGRETTGSALRVSYAVGVSSFPGKSYNSEPIPVPRNPYIKPGDWRREEIIEETGDGLLSRFFHYTRITHPTRGDFTSVLRMGLYQIKNGEVVASLRKARIIDNLFNLLANVDAVSDRLVVAGSWGSYTHTPVVRTKAHVVPVG